jgi:hypothetical protein
MSLAVVYNRKINDQILTFAASGWTYVYTFVLYDWETESMWLPANGGPGAIPGVCNCGLLCIAGEYAGEMVSPMTSVTMPWNNWVAAFPNSKIMVDPDQVN